ncbi:hypothetical protein [Geodermatophilus sp. URMC 64]
MLHIVVIEEQAIPKVAFARRSEKGLASRLRNSLDKRTPEFPEVQDLPRRLTRLDVNLATCAGSGFFLLTIALLWTFNSLEVSTTLGLYLSWALIFFVDDWIIISDYLRAFRGRMLKTHKIRIVVASVLLAPPLIMASFDYLHIAVAISVSPLLLLLLFWQWFALTSRVRFD